jgi:hypothetical protein
MPEGKWPVYRGVSGKGKLRRIRGFSWTLRPEVAAWFAIRSGLPGPAIYALNADMAWAWCYLKGRREEEVVLDIPPSKRLRRWKVDREWMEEAYARYGEDKKQ